MVRLTAGIPDTVGTANCTDCIRCQSMSITHFSQDCESPDIIDASQLQFLGYAADNPDFFRPRIHIKVIIR